MRIRLASLVVALMSLLFLVVFTPSASAVVCSTPWGSLAKSSGTNNLSQSLVVGLRTGKHDCYDRLVIDTTGTVGAWRVLYVDAIRGIATGDPIPTAGGAKIQITVFNPSRSPLSMPSVAGFSTFRQVVNAGTFEGVSEFGLGVRARLPMRAFVVGNRLVVDVAHHW